MESMILNVLLVVIAVSGVLVLGILTIFLVSIGMDYIDAVREPRRSNSQVILDYMADEERLRKELDARKEVVDRH